MMVPSEIPMSRCLSVALFMLSAQAWAQDYGTTHRLKVTAGGEPRKAAFFVPKDIKKNEALPLVVAVPGTEGLAYTELGQWEVPASKGRFCVLSVDVMTSRARGWLPSEQVEMKNDMEAIDNALVEARKIAPIDDTAIVITGFSGGTYLTLWMGARRPDTFLGICGRACVFFKEATKFTAAENIKPNLDVPVLLYRGDADVTRAAKETELAAQSFKEAGFRSVTYRVIPKMSHESKPEVFLEWFATLLKETQKGRTAVKKIRKEVETLRQEMTAGIKAGFCGRVVALAGDEKRAGLKAGAQAFLDEVTARAKAAYDAAQALEGDGKIEEALAAYKAVEETYKPLEVAKEAAASRARLKAG